jgi:hypothetical protein
MPVTSLVSTVDWIVSAVSMSLASMPLASCVVAAAMRSAAF